MRLAAVAGLLLIVACTSLGGSHQAGSTPSPSASHTSTAPAPVAAGVPPPGAERVAGGCGSTDVFRNGVLPNWATVNAPRIPYVVAAPGSAVGYVFTFPLSGGLNANNKILWYVGTPRADYPLLAEGHPLGANSPMATFSKAADSGPGEIYPSGPTVPAAGCWHFTLLWLGGRQRAEIDLLFN